MTLLDSLSDVVGGAFEQAGLPAHWGRVRLSDRPDLSAFQCNGALGAAKAEKRNPRDVAGEVVERLRAAQSPFSQIDVAGPGFINLDLSAEDLQQRLAARRAAPDLLSWRRASPENVVIDYGGPNVAKPLHVGHLRAAIIGEAIKRIMRRAGDQAVGDVHLGDWGLQMGQLITELELEAPNLIYFDAAHKGPYPDEPPITLADLERMYPAASAASKADPERAAAARRATRALQEERPGYIALWRHFVALSTEAMRRDYDDLGVSFDLWKGESDAAALTDRIEAELAEKGVIEPSDGAQIIRVARDDDKKEMPPIIYRNSQGAVGYHATDVATILDRTETIGADRMLYVVDARQRLHFEQVFRAVDKAGVFPEDRLEHLWFGTMNGPDGKPFKTREGGALKLRDLIELVTTRARERLAKEARAPLGDADDNARAIGVAALKFADLSNPRTSDYVFDLDRFLSFEGKTGPYLLYARARIGSVIEKSGVRDAIEADIFLTENEERDLALALLSFDDRFRDAYERRLPHIICDHAFDLAQRFSKLYAAHRFVDEADAGKRASRLALADLVAAQLDAIFELLALPTPARM